MGYSGGLGAGRGWLKLQFLVGSEVLRETLIAAKSVLVVHNRRVPTDYRTTPLDDYLDGYSLYLNPMLESAEAAQRASMGVYIGLTDSIERFTSKPCPDTRFKLVDSDNPTINLTPFNLCYDTRRGRLWTHVASKLYFGVEVAFPRVISLDRDGHEVFYETGQFPTFVMFQQIKLAIQKVTIPCRIRSLSLEYRTAIRITNDMRATMKRHPGLKAAHLELL